MNLWAVWHKSSGLGDLMEKNMGKRRYLGLGPRTPWSLSPQAEEGTWKEISASSESFIHNDSCLLKELAWIYKENKVRLLSNLELLL